MENPTYSVDADNDLTDVRDMSITRYERSQVKKAKASDQH